MLLGVRPPNDAWPAATARKIERIGAQNRASDPNSALASYREQQLKVLAAHISGLQYGDPQLSSLLWVHTTLGGNTDSWAPSPTQQLLLSKPELLKFDSNSGAEFVNWLIVLGLRDVQEKRSEAQREALVQLNQVRLATPAEEERDAALRELRDLRSERDGLHKEVMLLKEQISTLQADLKAEQTKASQPQLDRDDVVIARIEAGETHTSIAEDLGLSRARVSQIAARAREAAVA